MNTPNDELGVPRIVQLENLLDEILDFLATTDPADDDYQEDLDGILERGQMILTREGEEDELAAYE